MSCKHIDKAYMNISSDNVTEIKIRGRSFFLHKTLLETPYPQTLSLESTNFCNISCSHCGQSQFPEFSKGHFDTKYFTKVEHLLGSKIKNVSLSNFGEPLISRVWSFLLDKALSINGLNISFVTNGILLDKHIDNLLDPKISIAVSIDGASEKTYGYFRGKNNFSKLISNLNLLKEKRHERGIDYPYISFLFTVSSINCHELKDIIELAKSFDVQTVIVQFQLFFNRDRFKNESIFFRREDYDKHISLAKVTAQRLGINLIHPDSFDGNTFVPRDSVNNTWLDKNTDGTVQCFSQLKTCYIKYNGLVEACCAPDQNIMGDLNCTTFEDIWFGPYYRDLRLSFDRGEWPSRCNNCNQIQAIDVHSEKSHFIDINWDFSDYKPYPQPYSIKEIDHKYREALAHLSTGHEKAFTIISPFSKVDTNLYEIGNLVACLNGIRGDMDTMQEQLKICLRINPKDPVILKNYNTITGSEKNWLSKLLKL
ncbi:MAG: hypothetical protein A2Y97_06775 [Nitrospirae bacterium RBG_13_39_12]|nr:MAG: hypothetical protein A2Y97_06775 [Nitrospirae bacterium RBG_13_39_12]